MITADEIITELAKQEIFLTKDDPIIFLIMSEMKLLEKMTEYTNNNISTNNENINKKFQVHLKNIIDNDLENFKSSSKELNDSLISISTRIDDNLKRMESINSMNLSIFKALKKILYVFMGSGLVLVSFIFYFIRKFS